MLPDLLAVRPNLTQPANQQSLEQEDCYLRKAVCSKRFNRGKRMSHSVQDIALYARAC